MRLPPEKLREELWKQMRVINKARDGNPLQMRMRAEHCCGGQDPWTDWKPTEKDRFNFAVWEYRDRPEVEAAPAALGGGIEPGVGLHPQTEWPTEGCACPPEPEMKRPERKPDNCRSTECPDSERSQRPGEVKPMSRASQQAAILNAVDQGAKVRRRLIGGHDDWELIRTPEMHWFDFSRYDYEIVEVVGQGEIYVNEYVGRDGKRRFGFLHESEADAVASQTNAGYTRTLRYTFENVVPAAMTETMEATTKETP